MVGRGLTPDLVARVRAELTRTARLYPLLDHEAAWGRALDAGVFVGAVATAAATAAPRIYVDETPSGITLFDGLPLDPAARQPVIRAADLAADWEHLHDRLEGRFCIVRVTNGPVRIELMTDPIGLEQVFVHEGEGWSLISNSAGLVERVIDATEPDPLGVSMFLTLDWVGSDRTIRRAVRVIPGGQRWTWTAGDPQWTRRRYWSVEQAIQPICAVDDAMVDAATHRLIGFAAAAAAVNGHVNAPISGGRDSRLIVALTQAGGIPTRYWTKGDPGSRDVAIAREVVAKLGLEHRFANRPTQPESDRDPTLDIATEWTSLSERFVAQNDGLASLTYIGNIQGQPTRIDEIAVTLAGLSGESTRAVYGRPYLFGPGASLRRTRSYLPGVFSGRPNELVRPEAFATAVSFVRDELDRLDGVGVAVANLPTAFYLTERARRWAANNPRELAQTEDKALIYLTRPYVETALSLTPEDSWLERFHRRAMGRLVPGLEEDPPFDLPWRDATEWPTRSELARNALVPRIPLGLRRSMVRAYGRVRPPRVGRAVTSPYDEPAWIEANLTSIRDLCLSSRTSDLWAYLDRQALERLLEVPSADDRRRLQLPLLATITLFQFEAIERVLAAPGALP